MKRALIIAAIAIGLIGGGILLYLAVTGIEATLPDVSALAHRTPARTALMRLRAAEAEAAGRRASVDQRWVPYGRISPLLRRAVLIAEDDAFFSHDGLDWNEMQKSMRINLAAGHIVRGGSTITQQLAKNLFLGPERTVTRKLKEILLARRLEAALDKRRIFELYLNLIEWGNGIYGIEAAARRHFGVPAAALDARQSALLAAVIINPRRFDPAHPDRRIERRARMILSRMWHRGFISEAEYLAATGQTPPPAAPLFGPAESTGTDTTPPAPAESLPALPPDTASGPPGR